MNAKWEIIRARKRIKDLEAKTLQALRIRLKLIERTSLAIKNYQNTSDDKERRAQLSILLNTLKLEGRFLKIINKGISNAISISKEVISDLKKANAPKNIIDNIKILLKKLNKVTKKLNKIERRRELQEVFLSTKSGNDFEKFSRAFEAELKVDRKLLKILNPSKIQPIIYVLEKSLEHSGMALDDIRSLMGGGAAVGAYTNIQMHGSLHPSIIISVMAGLVGGALAKILMEVYIYEKQVYEIQKASIKDLRK